MWKVKSLIVVWKIYETHTWCKQSTLPKCKHRKNRHCTCGLHTNLREEDEMFLFSVFFFLGDLRYGKGLEGREEQTKFWLQGRLIRRFLLCHKDVEIFEETGRSAQAKEVKLALSPSPFCRKGRRYLVSHVWVLPALLCGAGIAAGNVWHFPVLPRTCMWGQRVNFWQPGTYTEGYDLYEVML